MNVLIDRSVWVEYFKQRNDPLVSLLEADSVVCHAYIVTEVACGTPLSRKAVIS
jgi:predicted nucleic acid-binding protein